ncbi:MAG TPA: aldehyde dehydrogenase family protein, partial [Oceanospirillales bacterium]|nr:aldehyde dehydrogenase family protein [Oceanospirillales bacterium]
RISVCNALDKVFIHKNHSVANLKFIASALKKAQIQIVTDESLADIGDEVLKDEAIFYQEFLAPVILLAQIDSLDDAIRCINKYSGGHSAVIVSSNQENAKQFQHQVDCAAVYHNASTRFTDGGEFGLGAEIAISTQKLHFRGPVGLHELVTNKWFINGNGHTRG